MFFQKPTTSGFLNMKIYKYQCLQLLTKSNTQPPLVLSHNQCWLMFFKEKIGSYGLGT